MIKINLLPEEYIQDPPTPVTRIAFIGLGAAVAIGSFFMYMYFNGIKNEAQGRLTKSIKQRKALEKKGIEKDHKGLKTLVSTLDKRESAIEDIKLKRTELSHKLYQLTEIVKNGGGEATYPVWLDNIAIKITKQKSSGGRRKKKGASNVSPVPLYEWKSKVQYAGSSLLGAVAFHNAIVNNKPFMKDFLKVANPNYTKFQIEEQYVEETGYETELAMVMQMKRKIKPRKPKVTEEKKKNNRRGRRTRRRK